MKNNFYHLSSALLSWTVFVSFIFLKHGNILHNVHRKNATVHLVHAAAALLLALHIGCAVKTLLGLQFFNWVIITLSLICSCLLQLTHSPRSIPTHLSPSNLSQRSNSFISTRLALVEKNVLICFLLM